MGISPQEALTTIRISFGEQNTVSEVIEAAEIINSTIKEMRT
jgi:cysteine sulfinate desulfinase/cysteine desulfurase-like protein